MIFNPAVAGEIEERDPVSPKTPPPPSPSPPLLLSTVAAEAPLEEGAEEATVFTVAEFLNAIGDTGVKLPAEGEGAILDEEPPTPSVSAEEALDEIGRALAVSAAPTEEELREMATRASEEEKEAEARGLPFHMGERLVQMHAE
ncbi:MAG: hypothetical protein Q9191_006241, partial [Dirinaria sp. TL-2023a]